MRYKFEAEKYLDQLAKILAEISSSKRWSNKRLQKILRKYPKDGNSVFSKDQLIAGYRFLLDLKHITENSLLFERIKMKPTRTLSGVTTVTVLTKPFPCPGNCIYCPNDIRMPKSYLRDEPGAQRAERNAFDPYLQVYNRLLALQNTGHNTEKVELIILGGTWSFYPEAYKIWFVKRCFDAMNEFGVVDNRDKVIKTNIFEEQDKNPNRDRDGKSQSYNQIINNVVKNKGAIFIKDTEQATYEELWQTHLLNEEAKTRNVGLVIETRPDYITEQEVINIRKLGATKVQIGVQSLNDKVQRLNKRGHGIKETRQAFSLLRQAGFKIHVHWMPGLYGSSVRQDINDYKKLWGPDFCPDELKIYPVSIIKNTELDNLFRDGTFVPYSYQETLEVLTATMQETPRFCRITRVIRDIPSQDIVSGNKLTNFRQIAELDMMKGGKSCECIRCREIRKNEIKEEYLQEEIIEYITNTSTEFFLSYKTKKTDKIVGFLRLSLPIITSKHFFSELIGSAIIREIHVYGQVVGLGQHKSGKSQHLGIGTKLITHANEIARAHHFKKIAVISAVGTRQYYEKKGFHEAGLYMTKKI